MWNNASSDRGTWLLIETITAGVGTCAEHVTIALTPRSDGGLDVELSPIGTNFQATGTLARRP